MQDDLTPFIPFEKLRGRTLVWCFLLTSFLSSVIHFELNRAWSDNSQNLLPDAIGSMLFHLIFLICISPILFRSRLSYKQLFGIFPTWSMFGWYTLWVFPLLILSFVIYYLQYLPLHYLFPKFTDWWFNTFYPSIPISAGEGFTFVNLLVVIELVLIVPIVEEFFVRGILLTRWTIKWGTPTAILVSSLLFGVLHANIVDAFFFGYVLSILYIRTKSLYIPICIHVVNNFIAVVIEIVLIPMNETLKDKEHFVLEGSDWIWLTIGSVIIIPWIIIFIRRNLPNKAWRVPYLIETRF